MIMEKYIDLHTHTTCSDGKLNPNELMNEARKYGIHYLAITDHNTMLSEKEIKNLEAEFKEIELIPGSEIDCEFHFKNGREIVLHIVVLYPFSYKNMNKLRKILIDRIPRARKPYVSKLISNLYELGIDVGTYEELSKKYSYLGRAALANEMLIRGYVKSVNEAIDKYLGNFGLKLALKDLPKKISGNIFQLDELIDIVNQTQGMCVLAHLYYYKLTKDEEKELLEYFSNEARLIGGLEVSYRGYNKEQTNELKKYSEKYNLFPSAASDYHGYYETDSLDNKFEGTDIYLEMLTRWIKHYVE